MKRSMTWKDPEESSSSDESSSSSSSHSDTGAADNKKNGKKPQGKFAKRKSGAVDFDELRKHGYKGGLSILKVPQPKDDTVQDWSWSSGKEHRETKEVEESYQDRQKTRAALMEGELLANVQTAKEKKSLSFSQREKRKRDFGQASRGKNFVEEEKRFSRENGISSSFDT
ncbi:uncharacterized protein LOC126688036 [Mercurialis annua]|uniref:uncharacterized protein LOC126688036 n=1 Tax=Mercurialis annua TaxID=3986 RepID=UPI00215FF4A9|nr:uncharacterized protein LOC126688036 [Mercurialis annua]